MKTSENGISFIKRREDFRSEAYQDEEGNWTIGYGHTEGVKPGDTITKQKAEESLRIHIARVENAINRMVTVPLTQDQFDALVSFAYNIGTHAFYNSTLRRLLNLGCYEVVTHEMSNWRFVTLPSGEKVESKGLMQRRALEGTLFRDGHVITNSAKVPDID